MWHGADKGISVAPGTAKLFVWALPNDVLNSLVGGATQVARKVVCVASAVEPFAVPGSSILELSKEAQILRRHALVPCTCGSVVDVVKAAGGSSGALGRPVAHAREP